MERVTRRGTRQTRLCSYVTFLNLNCDTDNGKVVQIKSTVCYKKLCEDEDNSVQEHIFRLKHF